MRFLEEWGRHHGYDRAFIRWKHGALGLGSRLLGIEPFVPAVLPMMFGRTTRAENRELVGNEDAKLPPARSERIQQGIQGARLEVVPGSGHLAALERPEQVTRAMLDFLESL